MSVFPLQRGGGKVKKFSVSRARKELVDDGGITECEMLLFFIQV